MEALIMDALALTIDEAATTARECRAKIYQEINAGRLRAIKMGRSTRILVDDLKAYLAALPAIQSKAAAAPVANVKPHRQRTKRRRAA
jgi:excisionase family DNA binding protein